jgi:hypothetical protein
MATHRKSNWRRDDLYGVGRGCGLGRGLGVGVGLTGVAVGVAVVVAVGVAVGVAVAVGVGVGVPPPRQSQLPALTTTRPQSPLWLASNPTKAVTPTVVCPPLTGRNATSEKPRFEAATSVGAAFGVTMFAKSLLRVVTPAISGCPALKVPSENGMNCRFIVRIIAAAYPSAVDSVLLARAVMAKAVLDYDPTSIHVVRQVVTQRIRVLEDEIAIRHNNVVMLKADPE